MSKDKGQAKKAVIEVLNKARAMELQAISQYMNQHYNLSDMDYGELAAQVKLIAIDEMQHAEQFAERIKELDGEPTADLADTVQKGQKIGDIFQFDTTLEDDTVAIYNEFLKTCRELGDNVSVKIFEDIIDQEQVHYNYFDNIRSHIESLGDNYLARIAGTPSATGLNTQGFVARQGGANAGA